MTRLKRFPSAIERYVGTGAALLIVLMMTIIIIDVVMRKVLSPVAGIFEFVEFLMVFIVFGGLAFTESRGANIKMTALTNLLGNRAKCLLEAIGLTLCLFVILLLALSSIEGTRVAWRVGETTAGLVRYPVWYAKAILALGSLLLCFRLGANIVNQIRQSSLNRGGTNRKCQ